MTGVPSPAAILRIEGLNTYYGESHILQGVSLSVAAGEVVAILGRNGVGKTTLLRSIIGFTPPRRGEIIFAGKNLERLPAHRIARLGLALVPQGRRIFPSLSVAETLQVGSVVSRYDQAGRSWTIERVFSAFPRLREREKQRAGLLSGGEQQMLATGRALVGHPLMLLLDEPTEGLSPRLTGELLSLLLRLKGEGVPMLLVEQQMRFALRLADRVAIMSKGRIVHTSTSAEFAADRAAAHRYLGL